MEEKPNWKEITIYDRKTKEIFAILTLNKNMYLKDIGVDIEIKKV